MQQKTNEIPLCRFCKQPASGDIIYNTNDIFGNHYQILPCQNCKAYFLYPPPDDKILAQAYDITYYGKNLSKFNYSIIERGIDVFRKQRARKLASYLPPHSRVLDIGCGNGNFLKFLKQIQPTEIYGIELNDYVASRARQIPEIHLKSSPLTDKDFPDGYFDAVTMFHVFEHLSEPQETIDIIRRILKPNGILEISFPNIVSWQAKWFKGKWFHLDPPRHLLFFEPNDFIQLMKNYNFVCLNTSYYSLEQNPYGFIQSFLNLFYTKRDVLFERLKGNTEYASNYSALNIFFQKLFFMISLPFFALLSLIESAFKKGGTVNFIFKKL